MCQAFPEHLTADVDWLCRTIHQDLELCGNVSKPDAVCCMAVQGQPTGSEDLHVKVEDSIDAFDGVPGQDGSSATPGVNGGHEESSADGIQSTIEGFQVANNSNVEIQ